MDKQTLKQKIHALIKEIGVMSRSKENPYYKSLYFDINDLIEHLEPLLEKYNLMIIQPLTIRDGQTGLKTIIHDMDSDEIIETEALLPNGLNAQQMGGAITFLRRYSIKTLLFIREEDDDANKAVNNVKLTSGTQMKPMTAPKKLDINELPFTK